MISFLKQITNPYGNRRVFNNLYFFAKLFNRLINIFLFPIFKILKIKLLKSPMEAVGHQIHDIECFFYEKKKYKYNFIPLILASPKFVGNTFLLEKQKKIYRFYTIKNKLLCTLLYYQKKFDNISFDTSPYLATRGNAKAYSILKKTNLKIKFSKEEIQYAKNILKEKKIKLQKKLVILHVRDDSYKPYDGESYRSSDIKSFKHAVEWLVRNDYQIIRIGNKGMVKSNFDNLIIDTTQKKFGYCDPILDFYLTSISTFFIATCSGPEKIAQIFNIPVVSCDMAPLAASLPLSKKCIALPKLVKNTKTNEILTFYDLIKFNFADLRLNIDFKNFNLKCIKNTPSEILNAVKEIEKKTKAKDFRKNKLQKKFDKLFHKDSYCYGSEATVSSTFINKYKNLL